MQPLKLAPFGDVCAACKQVAVKCGGLVHSSYHTSPAFIATLGSCGSIAIDLVGILLAVNDSLALSRRTIHHIGSLLGF